jgi:FeS assembly protein SufD
MNISIESVRKISEELKEPEWVRNFRLGAFEESEKLPIPQSRYSKLPGFSLGNFKIMPPSNDLKKELYGDADFVQVDNQIVKTPTLDKVIVENISDAFRNRSGLFERYIFNRKRDSISHDKFEMLTFSLYSSGMFVYVPEGAKSTEPLYANFFLTATDSIMFAPVVVIAEKGADLKIIQNFKSISKSGDSVLSAAVYLFLEDGSHIEYVSIRESGENLYSFSTFHSHLKNGARLDWRHAWFGGKLQRANIINYLEGEDSKTDEVQVFFLDNKEHLDITSRLEHIAPRTTSRVLVKGALRDRARAVFQGNVRIEKNAQETDSFLSDHVLLLNPGARADSIPALEIEANQVRASHSASIGQIDEEQVFYLMSRGLDESDAKKTIVSGFLSPAIDSIPHEHVRERFWKSFESRW